MNKQNKICPICKREFKSHHHRQIYCGLHTTSRIQLFTKGDKKRKKLCKRPQNETFQILYDYYVSPKDRDQVYSIIGN